MVPQHTEPDLDIKQNNRTNNWKLLKLSMTTMKTGILKLLCIKNENLLIWKFIDQSQLWLNHKFVDAGMGLLKSAYPQVQGMQDCIMSDTLNFQSVKGNFVQILNCARNHWICVST